MNIAQLRTLVTIAEGHGFAVTAEKLFVTPAAVSQQMRSLENELQVPIFDRNTRPPRLNAHGVYLADRARDVLHSFDAFVDAAKSPGELAGRLVLGCVSGVSSDLVPRALANLRNRYPRLTVRIEEGLSDPLIHRVRRRELDAAIVTEPAVPHPDLQSVLILTEALIVVAPKSCEASTWQEALCTLPYLSFNRNSGLGAMIDRTLRSAGLVVDEAMELDASEVVISMARAGLGAGVVPAGRLSDDMDASLKAFPFGDPPVFRNVILIERKNNQLTDLSDVLYQELRRITEVR